MEKSLTRKSFKRHSKVTDITMLKPTKKFLLKEDSAKGKREVQLSNHRILITTN